MQDFDLGKASASTEADQNLLFAKLKKTLRIMKLTTVLILVTTLQTSAKSWGQEQITLSYSNAPLEKILGSIMAQTDFFIVYRPEYIKDKKVTINIKNATIENALDECLKNQELAYKIVGRNVVIHLVNQRNNKVLSDSGGQAFFIDVKGRVTNENGDPVQGVTVTVKGTQKSTATNSNGEFSISTVDPDAVLVFTHVSMEAFELKVKGKSELTINLKTKVAALGDVHVSVNTGYQQLPKERATGSFGFIDNKLLNRSITTNLLPRIENVTPGVLFNHGNAGNTDPLLIRGRGSIFSSVNPLIVIDNFPYDGDINNINPNDIESISILRDAAAASIWGARSHHSG